VCPASVATWVMEGYFHTWIWFCTGPAENPCVDTISLEFRAHIRLHTLYQLYSPNRKELTCEPVSYSLTRPPVKLFQNRIFLSAVPPPLASRPLWCGLQAIALTAARCSPNLQVGLESVPPQMKSLLSLPPLASWKVSAFHFRPQTSCL